MAGRLRELMSELDLKTVHGKMPAAEIDETMVAFADGAGDVLLATDIIESGLDLPRANTILIWRPDRFGAAQLHQLRGRVGRGRRRGLACLLTDPDATIAPATEKRLRLLTEHSRLGAGFAISRRDMDLRGARRIARQGTGRACQADRHRTVPASARSRAGGRRAAGACRRTARSRSISAAPEAIPGAIPADYVSDPEIRINLYARLARLRDLGRIDDFAAELSDRFGPPPDAARALLEAARVQRDGASGGAVQVDAGPRGIAVAFDPAEAMRGKEIRDGRSPGSAGRVARLVSDRSGDRYAVALTALIELFDRLRIVYAGSIRNRRFSVGFGAIASSSNRTRSRTVPNTHSRAAQRYANPACARGCRTRSARPGTGAASISRCSRPTRQRSSCACSTTTARPRSSGSRCPNTPTRFGTASCPMRGPGRFTGIGYMALRAGERASLQPEQAADRPVCEGAARPS